MKISVVVPVYNEVDSIPQLHNELRAILSDFDSYEIWIYNISDSTLVNIANGINPVTKRETISTLECS